ncbi:MAG: VOC family protein [Mycobacteriaceae bacterium]|uniref:VOC family protein n=1 Tax=Corynebacterium sp. TaxID=1720 RepID=UPI003F960111
MTSLNRTPLTVKKQIFVLDCPDAAALADFYARLLGWTVVNNEEYGDWVDLFPPEGQDLGFTLAFQQIEGFRAPEWPTGSIPQQAHLDFHVPSIPEAGVLAEEAGAVRHEVQPGSEDTFIVFLDPVGHPFCLCQEE